MKKINVCHVMSALEAGGVEAVVMNYCSHMNLAKYNMHILHQRKPSEKNINEFRKLGFFIKEIPEKTKHPIKNYRETKKYFIDNKIDVVHAHMTLVNFIPLLAAKKVGIKIRISHSHNSDVRKKNFFKLFFEKILKLLTNYYCTIRVSCGEDAGKYLYGKKDFIILNNALDLSKYKYNEKNKIRIKKEYGLNNENIIIGNIGRFTIQKNQKFLLEVFSELVKKNKNYILFIIGDGELKEELSQYAKELNIDDNVIFTGIVNNTNEYYSVFDLFVLPSLWEGLPVVGVEAQASGVKCLFSNKIDIKANIIKENIKNIPLELKCWVNEILSIDRVYDRCIDDSLFANLGFDINSEVKKLDNIYGGK